LIPDASGHFGPVQVKRDAFYEFKGFDTGGDLIGYQYFTPFKRSNRLARVAPSGILSPAPHRSHRARSGHTALIALGRGASDTIWRRL
jgi:hypothetical protein